MFIFIKMKNLIIPFLLFFAPIFLKSEITLKANSYEDKDASCIALLQIASEKSKKEGEMVKFEKLKSLQNKYISKYPENYFSDDVVRLNIDDHNLNIKENMEI